MAAPAREFCLLAKSQLSDAFAQTAQERKSVNMHRSKLLYRRAIPLTTGDTPVRTDVFLHNLEPITLEMLRRAMEQGLTLTSMDFTGDDDGSIVILRFTRPPEMKASESKSKQRKE